LRQSRDLQPFYLTLNVLFHLPCNIFSLFLAKQYWFSLAHLNDQTELLYRL